MHLFHGNWHTIEVLALKDAALRCRNANNTMKRRNKTREEKPAVKASTTCHTHVRPIPLVCLCLSCLQLPSCSCWCSCSPQIGAYHTLDLELNQVFSIEKDVWDVIHLERIETSSDPAKKVCCCCCCCYRCYPLAGRSTSVARGPCASPRYHLTMVHPIAGNVDLVLDIYLYLHKPGGHFSTGLEEHLVPRTPPPIHVHGMSNSPA